MTAADEKRSLFYLEFYDRRAGASIEDFHRVAREQMAEWTALYEDPLLLNIGRTWRMGPFPYLMVWPCDPVTRLDEWDVMFTTGQVDEIEAPVTATMTTNAAGVYRALLPARLPTVSHRFYVETFEPCAAATDAYAEGIGGLDTLFVAERIGCLGPDPGGVAVFALPRLSDAAAIGPRPHFVVAAGTYATIGSEVL